MKKTLTLLTMTLAAASAFASGPEQSPSPIRAMLTEARALELEARQASQLLKKKTASGALHESIQRKGEAITRLRALASEFEAATANLTPAQAKEWESVKTRLQLLEIFHSQKRELAAGDLDRNRGLLRAHADGLAFRAAALQKTLTRMNL